MAQIPGIHNPTPWTSFVLNIECATTNPTKGTIARDEAKYRRVGDSMEIEYNFRQTTGGTNGSGGAYLFRMPAGFQIDVSKLGFDDGIGTQAFVGSGVVANSDGPGPSICMCYVAAFDANTLRMFFHNEVSTTNNIEAVTDAQFPLGGTNQRYSFKATVPIVGWS